MKNRVFVLLFILFPATQALCQMSLNDSVPVIKNMLKGEMLPETRLEFLTKLCAWYWHINPDSSLWYGIQGKALFNDKMPLRSVGRHQFVLGMAWENKGNFDSALWYLNQAADNSVRAGDTKYLSLHDPRISASFQISQAHLLNNQGKKSQVLALLQKVARVKGEIIILQNPLSDLERTFGQIHGCFYEKLPDAIPELSETELQICALLRINLSSKDIARLVNLSASTVDVTRSHIRKKLGFDQSQSLTSYLIMQG